MLIRVPYLRSLFTGLALLAGAGLSALAAAPGTTERVSVAAVEGDNASFGPTSVSADGRYVAFASDATNLFGLDDNNLTDIYLRDRATGFTHLVSQGNPAVPFGNREIANGASSHPSLSGNGQWVAFVSEASNIVTGDGNDLKDVFVRNVFGNALRVSVSSTGAEADGDSLRPQISQNGTAIVYTSDAKNLVGGDTNDLADVFITRLTSSPLGGTRVQSTQRVSVNASGEEADGDSDGASVSADGRLVAFHSEATNLVEDDTNDSADVFVKDTFTGEVIRASADVDGFEGDGESRYPSISADGRYVAFISTATNLVFDDTNDCEDVFVKDLLTGDVERVSVNDFDEEGDDASGDLLFTHTNMPDSSPVAPAISGEGRYVAFVSVASNLVFDDTNDVQDVFVRDRFGMVTSRASVSSIGAEGDLNSVAPSISANGSTVAFMSDATSLAIDDTNGYTDVFARTLSAGGGANLPPEVDVELELEVFEGEEVVLDASATIDPEDDILTFKWRQLPEPDWNDDYYPVELVDADTATASFTAPLVSNYTELYFELTVSDGINEPVVEEVVVLVDYAPPAVVSGYVMDAGGAPVEGATVEIVREDGELASLAFTDFDGFYSVPDVRVGPNTAVVRAPGFELVSRNFTVASGEELWLDFELVQPAATLLGGVYLSNGDPVEGAFVQYVDRDGEILAEAVTDFDGTYVLEDLDSEIISQGTAIRVDAAPLPVWVDTGVRLTPGSTAQRDFRYGHLTVNVDTQPRNLRKKLPNTTVEVWIGSELIAENEIGKRTRKAVFANVPATGLRVRAYNDKLTGDEKDIVVFGGTTKNGKPKTTNVTLKLRRRNGL